MTFASNVLAALVIGAALFFGGYFLGKADQRADTAAADGKSLQTAVEKHDKAAAAGSLTDAKTVSRETAQRRHTDNLLSEANSHAQTHPAADCSLDPFGMYQWRAANRGAAAVSVGDLDERGGVPGGATAAEERLAGRLESEPHRDGRAVPLDARALSRPGGVAAIDGTAGAGFEVTVPQ